MPALNSGVSRRLSGGNRPDKLYTFGWKMNWVSSRATPNLLTGAFEGDNSLLARKFSAKSAFL
jgi:hypothetical protein